MTSIKEKIAKILKDAFDIAPVITPQAASAPVPPAAPVAPAMAMPIPYTLSDGTQILITQAGQVPAIGDTVSNIDGSLPAAGVLTLEDGSTLTVDASGAITEVGAASPVTTDLAGAPPVPTLEERIAAIENAIARASQPKFEISKEEFEAVKAENEKAKKALIELSELVAIIGGEATGTPETLTGAKLAKFERDEAKKKKSEEKEEKLQRFAGFIGEIRKNNALK